MTHHLTDKDFSACVFNPLTKKELSKAYPDLAKIHGNESILRYIVAMYDQNSPLVKMHPELIQRKQVAAAVAGLSNEPEEFLDDLFGLKDDEVVRAISLYLKTYGAPKVWMMIVSQEQMFQEYFDRVITPVEAEKDTDLIRAVELKSKLAAEMDLISTRLEGYYRKLYGDDEELLNQSKALRFTPEMVALKIKEKKGVQ